MNKNFDWPFQSGLSLRLVFRLVKIFNSTSVEIEWCHSNIKIFLEAFHEKKLYNTPAVFNEILSENEFKKCRDYSSLILKWRQSTRRIIQSLYIKPPSLSHYFSLISVKIFYHLAVHIHAKCSLQIAYSKNCNESSNFSLKTTPFLDVMKYFGIKITLHSKIFYNNEKRRICGK